MTEVYVRRGTSTKWTVVSQATLVGTEATFNPPVVLQPGDVMSFEERVFKNSSTEVITIDRAKAVPKG